MKPLFLAMTALLFGAAPGLAQTIAITGGTVHTVSDGTLEAATVVIRDGRIAAVGRNIAIPPDARVIETAGKIITPGLLDSATHLGLVEISLSAPGTVDHTTTDERLTAAFRAIDGVNPNSTLIPVTRVEGVTRAVVMPAGGGSVIAGQGTVIDLSGTNVPDSVSRHPAAVFATLGETGAGAAGGSRATAMLRVREALQDAADYARNRQAFEAGQRRAYAPGRLDLEALVPLVEGKVPLAVIANRASDITAALRLGDDFQLRLVVLGAAEGWMVADELARRQVPVVIKPLANLPRFETLGATLENAARLSEAGVKVAIATFDSYNSRTLRQEAGNAVAYGMSPEAALQAVTLNPARIWGIDQHYGSIEAGKDADLVIWSGDPFELTTSAERIFIKGREMPETTRQRELLERYRDLRTLPR
jgi:imidazolonepropionase-like amidohydrolase